MSCTRIFLHRFPGAWNTVLSHAYTVTWTILLLRLTARPSSQRRVEDGRR